MENLKFKTKTKDERLKQYKKNIEKVKNKEKNEVLSKAKPTKEEPQFVPFVPMKPKTSIEERKTEENALIKRNQQPVDVNFVNNRCRYWVEQRLSQLLNNDNFTTRGGYSFSIDENKNKAGKCWRFTRNGQTVAKIDAQGYLYCANVWANGVNLLAAIQQLQKIIKDGEDLPDGYVRHKDLKNGEYVMDIDDITTNTITVKNWEKIKSTETTPLIIENTNEQWTPDGRYSKISINGREITCDRWNDSIIINGLLEAVDWGSSWQTMLYSYAHFNYFLHDSVSIVIGKEDMEGNSVEVEFVYNGDNDATNCLRLHFWDKSTEIVQMFMDKVVYGVQEVDVFNTNRDATLKIGSNDAQARCFVIFYKYMYDTSNCYGLLGLQGHPGLKFWTDKLEALLPLTIDTINATTINATTGNITNGYFNYISSTTASLQNIENIFHAFFYDLEDMIIDFKKHYAFYNDRGRIIYTTSGTYNNTLSLDINKSHSIICRVYSDGGGTGNTDYFTTIKHVITLLDGDGKTTLKDLETNKLTVNTSATFNINYIEELFANLSAGSETLFTFGQSTGLYQAGNLAYHLDSTLANSYIHLYLNGMSGLKIKADSVESVSPFVCPAITVNGNAIDAANIAYKNQANTFTQSQTITTAANSAQLGLINTLTANGSTTSIRMGKDNNTAQSNHGVIQYFHYSSQSDRHFDLGINNHTQIRMFDTSTKFLGKVETSGNNPDNVLGDNLKQAIFQFIYPVGSIYCTSVLPSSMPGYNVSSNVAYCTLYGCTFRLFPSKGFLRNGAYTGVNNVLTFTETAGAEGGQLTHSHVINSYTMYTTLTESQMPKHSHGLTRTVPFGTPYFASTGHAGVHEGANWKLQETYDPMYSVNTAGGDQGHRHQLSNVITESSDWQPKHFRTWIWYRTA